MSQALSSPSSPVANQAHDPKYVSKLLFNAIVSSSVKRKGGIDAPKSCLTLWLRDPCSGPGSRCRAAALMLSAHCLLIHPSAGALARPWLACPVPAGCACLLQSPEIPRGPSFLSSFAYETSNLSCWQTVAPMNSRLPRHHRLGLLSKILHSWDWRFSRVCA